MAGSWNHAVTKNYKLLNNENFCDMIENLGDAYEMAEEMYGMIWFLADGDAARVEEARRAYKVGLNLSPGQQPEHELDGEGT